MTNNTEPVSQSTTKSQAGISSKALHPLTRNGRHRVCLAVTQPARLPCNPAIPGTGAFELHHREITLNEATGLGGNKRIQAR
jgi:hypothetical protein